MDLPREFLALNLRFARRAVEISAVSLAEALLQYTHLYLAFGLGRDFNPTQPFWQAFLDGLAQATDPEEYTFQVYCEAQRERPRPHPELVFGCFTYSVWTGGRIRLHFFRALPGQAPLRRQYLPERVAELTALFSHVKANVSPAVSVVGGSWLYNIEAYRRLFPPDFIHTAVPEEPPETQFIALWGQLLDHNGQVKADIASLFLEKLAVAQTLKDMLHSFQYPVMRLEAPVEVFYRYYSI
jgi:hypothetical protein